MAEIFPTEGLDYILGVIPKGGTTPANLYLGLFTSQTASTVPARTMVLATPTGITEASYTSYARQTLAAGTWGAIAAGAADGRKTTYPQVTFPTVGATAGSAINGFFIASASSAGIALFVANFDDTTAITPATGDIIKVTPTWEIRE